MQTALRSPRTEAIQDQHREPAARELYDNARHLLETVAQLGARPEDALYVGDNPVDVAVARAAGVRYRHVAWGVPVDDVVALERFADLLEEEVLACRR